MESTEAKVNQSQIEKEFQAGLKNAESETPVTESGANFSLPDKLKLELPNVAVKLVCDIKNNLKVKILSRDLDEASRLIVEDHFRTSDKEILLYKRILEDVGTNYTPESYKELLNKWLASPIVLLLEHEIESLVSLKKKLDIDRASRGAA